jgi:thiamine biosynthesis lipoprotein ApbE
VIAFPATGRPVRVAKAVTIAAASKLVAEAFTTGIPRARDAPYFLSVKKRVG